MNIAIVFYSRYGNTAHLAEGIASGASRVEEADVIIRKVDETAPPHVIARDARWQQAHDEMAQKYPAAALNDLIDADAIILGSPTRYGNMSAELKLFLDLGGPLWVQGTLIGKIGAVFCTNSTAHGGKESTLLSMMLPLLHHGMIIVGVPPNIMQISAAGSYYGATATCGTTGEGPPTREDILIAEALGQRVAEVAQQLFRGKLNQPPPSSKS